MRGKRTFSINYVPWNELQTFRCRDVESVFNRCKHGTDTDHQWTLGGRAYYVPDNLHATFLAIAQDEARQYLRERGFLPTIRIIPILDDNYVYAPKACGRAVK